MFELDKAHERMDIFQSRMTQNIWRDKYRWKDEATPQDTLRRVANAIMPHTKAHGSKFTEQAYAAMAAGLWLPGGRILAGAGTEKRVTLMNCYVNATVGDSMEEITDALRNTMLTLQQGGGIGTDFSTLRPEGAVLRRTHTKASGPIPFMHTWDAASRTIRSAGDRRGAMMATMSDTHPDLIKFINAKTTKGALEQFNISILVSDALMEAIREDEDWVLHFPIEPVERDASLAEHDFEDENGKNFAYSVMKARELWEMITKRTYDYSEPGVIFIDRVNDLNNLWYCEQIRCTNPCGEQPLPPHGTCNLGHINLARVVSYPFQDNAAINFNLVKQVTRIGVRFLDNVIDATKYPLPQQEEEEKNKRRLGLGFTGLADMLAQLGVRYGSPEAVRIAEEVVRVIAYTAYEESVAIAEEKGSFPLFDSEQYLGGNNFATMLPEYIKDGIRNVGIRNSLLLTVAPTGTGSILYGNVSSGGEPVFLHTAERRVLKASSKFEDEWETYIEHGYGSRLFHSIFGEGVDLPSYMVTAEDLSVEDHVVMQAATQRYIDASMSKTISVPEDYSYDEFVKVYTLAYQLGCKGCTTYRPSEVRGAVLSKPGQQASTSTMAETLSPRPDDLEGRTYKIKWPSLESALYVTVNHTPDKQPFEVFIASKDSRYHDWTTALTTMITAIFRRGGDIRFVAQELQQVQSLNDSALKDKKFHPSLVAYIGFILEQHIDRLQAPANTAQTKTPTNVFRTGASTCPKCRQPTFVRKEGCNVCESCGHSTCG